MTSFLELKTKPLDRRFLLRKHLKTL